ncbi:hypothetical protein [Burkholderia anthina]|uniref:hypothetical protein n=1 Tax=Burkholderia anthina TaxID=179879 RepID=UPI00158A0FF7|nr:hypothetical protein [Burkholderia anthina]
MTIITWWGQVAKGDIAWCWFPNVPDMARPHKPRPVAIMRVENRELDGNVEVVAAYGSTQRLTVRYPYDVIVDAFVWQNVGLAHTTRFDFSQRLAIPFNSDWFSPPPWDPNGSPILGRLPLKDPAFKERINKAIRASQEVAYAKPAEKK